jgi:hypothetical protein
VTYTYQVLGREYQSNAITPGFDVGGTGAEKITGKYPEGRQVRVYYDPQYPSRAVLERGTPGYVKWLWLAMILLDVFVCGVAVILAYA